MGLLWSTAALIGAVEKQSLEVEHMLFGARNNNLEEPLTYI